MAEFATIQSLACANMAPGIEDEETFEKIIAVNETSRGVDSSPARRERISALWGVSLPPTRTSDGLSACTLGTCHFNPAPFNPGYHLCGCLNSKFGIVDIRRALLRTPGPSIPVFLIFSYNTGDPADCGIPVTMHFALTAPTRHGQPRCRTCRGRKARGPRRTVRIAGIDSLLREATFGVLNLG